MWNRRIQESDVACLPVMSKLIKKYPNHLTSRRSIKRLAEIAVEAGDLEIIDTMLSKVLQQDDYRLQLSLHAILVPELSKSADQKQTSLAARLLDQLTTVKVAEFNAEAATRIFRTEGLQSAVLRDLKSVGEGKRV